MNTKVAVVGMGYWGKNLVRNFAEIGALHTVCDSNSSVQALCKSYSNVKFCLNFKEVLANPEISAVALATPAVTHYEMAKAALEAGKDVFVEKPLAVEMWQGQELVNCRRSSGECSWSGHILRYHPAIMKLQEMVRERGAGKNSVPLLQPVEHRENSNGGEHPVELCATRHLGDVVAAERVPRPGFLARRGLLEPKRV